MIRRDGWILQLVEPGADATGYWKWVASEAEADEMTRVALRAVPGSVVYRMRASATVEEPSENVGAGEHGT